MNYEQHYLLLHVFFGIQQIATNHFFSIIIFNQFWAYIFCVLQGEEIFDNRFILQKII